MESTRDKLGRLQPAALLKVYSNTNFLQYVILNFSKSSFFEGL